MAASWNEGGYPGDGISGVADTASISHTITITANNVATCGAITISSGGDLICNNDGSAQNFCAAITVASGGTLESASNQNTKVLRVAGNITIASGGTYHGYEDFTLIIASSTSGQYTFTNSSGGNFYMVGSSGHTSNMKGDGSGKEMKCNIDQQSTSGIIHIDYADFQWGINIDTSSLNGAINFSLLGRRNYYNCTLGVVTGSNLSAAAIYGFNLNNCVIRNLNISCTDMTTKRPFYVLAGVYENCTFTATATTGLPLYSPYGVFKNCTIVTTATTGTTQFTYVSFDGGTISATATTAVGIDFYACHFRNHTTTGTSASNYAIRAAGNCYLGSGAKFRVTASGGASGVAMYLYYGFTIDGGDITINNPADGTISTSVTWADAPTFIRGVFKSNLVFSAEGEAWGREGIWQHNGERHLILTGAYPIRYGIYTTSIATMYEPFIFITNETTKKFNIVYPCYPSNMDNSSNDNFRWTGTVTSTTGDQIELAESSTLFFPQTKPWQVTAWSNSIVMTTTGGSVTKYYRTSLNGGTTWGAWTSFTGTLNLSAASTEGNGADVIEFKVENGAGSGTASIKDLTMYTNTYTDINGGTTYITDDGDMEYD